MNTLILILISIIIAFMTYATVRKNKAFKKEQLRISDGIIEGVTTGLSLVVANVAVSVLIGKRSTAIVIFSVTIVLAGLIASVVKTISSKKEA